MTNWLCYNGFSEIPLHSRNDEESHSAETENSSANEYLGVVYDATKVKKYSAELEIDGHVISGGDYWTALDAAKAYDELVTLYCDLDEPRNFPEGDAMGTSQEQLEEVEWQAPEAGNRHADIIPPIPQTYLTIDEIKEALEREKAIDVYTVDLAGKSSLADFMVFATGRSQAHMRRMADLLIKSMKARDIVDDFDYAVEGRDCDDWMIADCNNIVVHLMRADTRRILALEDHWENMVDDKHSVYGDMSEDEYMDRFGTSELMEYLEDEDHLHEDEDGEGSGVEWKHFLEAVNSGMFKENFRGFMMERAVAFQLVNRAGVQIAQSAAVFVPDVANVLQFLNALEQKKIKQLKEVDFSTLKVFASEAAYRTNQNPSQIDQLGECGSGSALIVEVPEVWVELGESGTSKTLPTVCLHLTEWTTVRELQEAK
ncbi:unnamed protein product [Phytophthora lilii]|uniref:Unnamed protein product n=1 Tax=Phytophthora lilii TaxID=2077276 RepID=A0A9W6U1X3_9STRA|nr:unnamed protein product [Phytophthora lilii]